MPCSAFDPAVRMALAPPGREGGQRILLVKALPLRVLFIISYGPPECKAFLQVLQISDGVFATKQKVYSRPFENRAET